MADPLAQVIELLRPKALFSKGITGAGRWAVSYSAFGHPGFCAVLEGQCRLSVDGTAPTLLSAGDFVLLPATPAFTMSGLEPATPKRLVPQPGAATAAEVRHGRKEGPPDVRLQGGYFVLDSPDAALILSLLPTLLHIQGDARLAALVSLFGEEARAQRSGRDLILARLAEVLLVESLRSADVSNAPPGLLRGLADERISGALRQIHSDPGHGWTAEELGRNTGMSRSAFFDRFTRVVGLRPMEYVAAWRMALAKDLLRRGNLSLDEVAERVGYGSASTFSTAFSRHAGLAPGRFARLAHTGL
ncbi:AraC family transcriptional regulator [Hyphomonas sp.]|uniref:AraC family transcriptional regulator n=1 Tax=Hyphomonas sp. TaxID=87 RepID=UPI00391DCFBF